jgi:hypothetical protein
MDKSMRRVTRMVICGAVAAFAIVPLLASSASAVDGSAGGACVFRVLPNPVSGFPAQVHVEGTAPAGSTVTACHTVGVHGDEWQWELRDRQLRSRRRNERHRELHGRRRQWLRHGLCRSFQLDGRAGRGSYGIAAAGAGAGLHGLEQHELVRADRRDGAHRRHRPHGGCSTPQSPLGVARTLLSRSRATG